VVDDDDATLGLVALALRRAGHKVFEARSGEAALDVVRTETIGLVVLDMGLPGMSGIELYDRLRQDERLRKIPVLFETAASFQYRREFQRRGIKAVVEKPFNLRDIVRQVRELAPPLGPRPS